MLESPTTPTEAYLCVRAAIILGRYSEAESRFAELGQVLDQNPAIARFLKLQLAIYRRTDLEAALLDLYGMPGAFSDPYLKAETLFVLGYVHSLLDEHTQASRHYRLACDSYTAAGVRGCASVALFNLCTTYDQLNARALYLDGVEELKSHSQGIPAAEILCAHLCAHTAINREDYPAAIRFLLPVLAQCRREDRQRDLGAVTWLLGYLYIKTGEMESFHRLANDASSDQITEEYRTILRELGALASSALLTADTALEKCRQWKSAGIDSIPGFFLIDLALERLLSAQQYETALQIAHREHQALIRKQMALLLVDFRYYEACALIKLGNYPLAEKVLSAYQADARALHSANRHSKAEALREGMMAYVDKSARYCVIDPENHSVKMGNHKVSLEKMPRIEQLLLALARRKGSAPQAWVFEQVYRCEYFPHRHERRLHSLIDRTRRLLGSELLYRREGRVGFSPHIQTEVLRASRAGGLTADERRQRLLRSIRSFQKPVGISELQEGYIQSRRTLQLDLQFLIRQGKLLGNGQARNRRYRPQEVL
ncbi:hypothetical protein K2X33_10530 [bacterium]|nr:hypothetical protein [bacterium]